MVCVWHQSPREPFWIHIWHSPRDARYTAAVKWPVFIIFQTVWYHNSEYLGISYAAVPKFTCRRQCFSNQYMWHQNKWTTRWINQIKLLTSPKQTNKENRSEIWHYFAYKTDHKGERTDHRRQHIQSGSAFVACSSWSFPRTNVRDRQVSKCIINA